MVYGGMFDIGSSDYWNLFELVGLLQPGQCIERIGYELLTNPFATYALLCYAKVNTLQGDAPQAGWWF